MPKQILTGKVGEEPGDQQQQQQQVVANANNQQQQQADVDPFSKIDIETLDDNTKASVVAAKAAWQQQQTTLKEINEKVTRVEGVASKYQSEAAQYRNKLDKHGLLEQQQQQQQSPGDQYETNLYTQYRNLNLPEDQAKSFAKIGRVQYEQSRELILREVGQAVGPAMFQTQSLAADRLLERAAMDPAYQSALRVPEVFHAAQRTISDLVNGGTQVSEGMIKMAIDSATGEAYRNGKLTSSGQTQVNQPNTQPNFPSWMPFNLQGGNQNNNGNFQAPRFQNGNQQQITDPDLARAMAATIKEMDRGIPTKKK